MLTVKFVEDNGYEQIIQCQRVSFEPSAPGGERNLFAFGCEPHDDGGAIKNGTAIFGSGVVYVMNVGGATVAKYNLN